MTLPSKCSRENASASPSSMRWTWPSRVRAVYGSGPTKSMLMLSNLNSGVASDMHSWHDWHDRLLPGLLP